MYCHHCGHKKIPEYPHACEMDFKAGKIKKLEIRYCTQCGLPLLNLYTHECGQHDLRNFWLQAKGK